MTAALAGEVERPRAAVWRATGLFAALALVATWPLALRLTTRLPAGANDLFQNVWSFWWWKKAIAELHASPYFTPFLYAPDGLDITFNTTRCSTCS